MTTGPPDHGADPTAGARRPRSSRTTRDLVLSLVPLAAVVLLIAGVAGMCSFSPGGPQAEQAAVPAVDAPAELARAARAVPFAVREPRLPSGWRANSFGLRPVPPGSDTAAGAADAEAETAAGRARAVRVGWLLPGGGYLRLSQSDATEVALVELETERRRPTPSGAVEVDGVTWIHYPSVRDEPAWVTDHAGVRLLVTGNATEPDLRTLASAVLAAIPLPGD